MSANLSATETRELPFSVSEAGQYVVSFTNESRSANLDEYLLLDCAVRLQGVPSAIRLVNADGTASAIIYDLRGHRYDRRNSLMPGIYIKNGKKVFIK